MTFGVVNTLIAIAVLAFGGAAYLLARALWPERFLREASEAAAQAGAAGEERGRIRPPRAYARAASGVVVQHLGNANQRFVGERWRQKIVRRFVAMGDPALRPQDFIAYQELCAVLFAALGGSLFYLLGRGLFFGIFLFGAGGFFLPYVWLGDRIRKRHHAIARALPYSIDLLTLSVEAGLDFQAAIATVVEKGRGGPLNQELLIMLHEVRLGKTREEALRNLADRVQLPQLTQFVSNLIQADRMGSSLGRVLRIQATQMRIERTQRAEKLANEAPVKMLFPLIACIFPTVFLVLFGPIIYRVMYGGLGW